MKKIVTLSCALALAAGAFAQDTEVTTERTVTSSPDGSVTTVETRTVVTKYETYLRNVYVEVGIPQPIIVQLIRLDLLILDARVRLDFPRVQTLVQQQVALIQPAQVTEIRTYIERNPVPVGIPVYAQPVWVNDVVINNNQVNVKINEQNIRSSVQETKVKAEELNIQSKVEGSGSAEAPGSGAAAASASGATTGSASAADATRSDRNRTDNPAGMRDASSTGSMSEARPGDDLNRRQATPSSSPNANATPPSADATPQTGVASTPSAGATEPGAAAGTPRSGTTSPGDATPRAGASTSTPMSTPVSNAQREPRSDNSSKAPSFPKSETKATQETPNSVRTPAATTN